MKQVVAGPTGHTTLTYLHLHRDGLRIRRRRRIGQWLLNGARWKGMVIGGMEAAQDLDGGPLGFHTVPELRSGHAQPADTIGVVGRGRAGARPAGQIRPHVDAADDRDPLAEPTGRSGRAHNPRALLLLSPDRRSPCDCR